MASKWLLVARASIIPPTKWGRNSTPSCFGVAPSAVTNDTIKHYAVDNSFGLVPAFSSFTVTPTPPHCRWPCPTNIGYVVTASAPYNLINYIFSVTLTATSKFPINCS